MSVFSPSRLPFFTLLLVFILSDCAQVKSPSGGPSDTTPPKIKYSEPGNFSTLFTGREIKIEFNEFVSLSEVQKEVIISPPMKEFPDFNLSGKKIIIRFKEDLLANTTYTLFLGKAIKDITEGNILDSNIFVFSTGLQIDSLSITGTVVNALDRKPKENILVMLYDRFDDSIPSKSLPLYFGKTNSTGQFSIPHIKNGNFKIFALEDLNNNFLYDLPDEPVAFSDSVLRLQKNVALTLCLFQPVSKKLFIKYSGGEKIGTGSRIKIVFNKPADNPQIRVLNISGKKSWEMVETSKNKDTLTWFTTIPSDSFLLVVTDNNHFCDTILVAAAKSTRNVITSLTFTSSVSQNSMLNPGNDFMIRFSVPVLEYDPSKIKLVSGTDTLADSISTGLPFRCTMDDSSLRNLSIKSKWLPSSSYKLLFYPKAFHDIFGFFNDSSKTVFKTYADDYWGTLKVNITIPDTSAALPTSPGTTVHPIIIQLLDEKYNLIEEQFITESKPVVYKNLHPGKYHMKAILDRNNNRKWDTGDYYQRHQPEKTVFYSTDISVRSNWENDEEWKVKF